MFALLILFDFDLLCVSILSARSFVCLFVPLCMFRFFIFATNVLLSLSGALKTDFTRTGKRTMRGLIDDGTKSLHRYFINNFQDGYKQDW